MPRVKLGDVAKEYKAVIKNTSGFPVVGLEHITPCEIALERWDEDVETTFTKGFKKGHVLFGRRRAYLKKAAVAPFDGICSGDIIVIEAIENRIKPELLPYIIQNDLLFDFAMSKSAGGLSPRVKWEDLKEFEFDLPDILEQDGLTDILSSAYETKQAYQKLLRQTDELVKSQYIEMFGNVKNNDYNYTKCSLTDVCDFQGGSQPPKKDWIQKPQDGYVRMLQIRDFTQSEKDNIEYVRISNAIKTCNEDDVLIGRYGASVGKILTGLSGAYNVAIMKSIPDLRVLNKTYLLRYFMSDEFQQFILTASTSRAAQAGFNKEDLSRMEIILPPMEKQLQYEKLVKQSDKSKFEIQQSIVKVENLMRSLIQHS